MEETDLQEENQIKECFAYFGRAIYMMQVVEKGLVTVLLNTVKYISRSRYDELLAEKFELTVGILKRDLADKGIFDSATLQKLDYFHSKRDWLAHSFWWDRAIEFDSPNLRYKIIDELDSLTLEFEELNSIVSEKAEAFLLSKGVDINDMIKEFRTLEATPERPVHVKLSKNETLTAIYLMQKDGMQTLIFELEGKGYWTLSDVGLSRFERRPEQELIPFEPVQEVLPVQQFNPRPKLTAEWHYDLDLKRNGLLIKVRPRVLNNHFTYQFFVGKA